MKTSEVASVTGQDTGKAGCCGSGGTHGHATPSHSVQHDHGSHAASKAGATDKPAERQKSGHGSGCCCS